MSTLDCEEYTTATGSAPAAIVAAAVTVDVGTYSFRARWGESVRSTCAALVLIELLTVLVVT